VVLSSPVHHCLERDRSISTLKLEQTWLGNFKHQRLNDFGGLCYKYRSRGESLYLNNDRLSDKVLYSGIIESSTVSNSFSKIIILKTTITDSEVVKVEDDTC